MLEAQTASPGPDSSGRYQRSKGHSPAHCANGPPEASGSVRQRRSVNQDRYQNNDRLSDEKQLDSKSVGQKHVVAEVRADGDRARPRSSPAVSKQKNALQKSRGPSDTLHTTKMPRQAEQVSSVSMISRGAAKPAAEQSTAQQPQILTPVKLAYAGPTFHASPAPSSLPVPRFFSKSLPGLDMSTSPQASLQGEPDGTKFPHAASTAPLPSPTPSSATSGSPMVIPPPRLEESPLEIFFRADKEEKARLLSQSGSSTKRESITVRTMASQSSPLIEENITRANTRQPHTRCPSDSSGRNMFMMELDGATEVSRSFQEDGRIRRELGNDPQLSGKPSKPPQGSLDESLRVAKTQALKKLLLSPQSQFSHSHPSKSPEEVVVKERSPNLLLHLNASTPRATGSKAHTQSMLISPGESTDLHYGNRNLSPLFQRASSVSEFQSKRTSSGLQRDFTPPIAPHNGSVHKQSPPTSALPSLPAQNAKLDISAFSRDYLNSHLRGALPNPNLQRRSISDRTVPFNDFDPVGSPASNQANTLQPMEQDLRRILNLHAFGDKTGPEAD